MTIFGDIFGGLDPTVVAKADQSGVAAAQKRTQQMADDFRSDAGTYQGRNAPQAALNAATVDTRAITRVGAPQIIGRNYQPNVEAAMINSPTMSDYERQALEQYQGAALGQAPSAAQATYEQAQDENARQAMALATARGASPAAVRGAEYQLGQVGQQAAQNAAMMRAQEMDAGRAGLLTGAQAQRAAQQQMAQYQAQLEQEANLYTSTAEGQAKLQEADMQLKAQLANQGVDLDALKFNAQQGNTVALANLEAMLRQAGLNDAMTLGYIQAATGLQSSQIQSELGMYQSEQQRKMQSSQTKGSIIGGIGGGLVGGLTSWLL